MKIGVTAGSFDLIHPGHILMFKDCKKVCNHLIVLLQSDPSKDRPEKNKPILNVEERTIILESIKYIDRVIEYDTEDDLEKWLKKNKSKIKVRILGSDYKDKDITGGDLDIPIYYHHRGHNWSSTSIRQRVYKAEKKKENE